MADMAKQHSITIIRAVSSGWIIHLLTASNTSTVFYFLFFVVTVELSFAEEYKKKRARRRTREKTLYKVEPNVTTKASCTAFDAFQRKKEKKRTFFFCL